MARTRKRGPVAEQIAAASETTSPADDTSFDVTEFEQAPPAEVAQAEPRHESPAAASHDPHITLADVVHAPAEYRAEPESEPRVETVPVAASLAGHATVEHAQSEPVRSHAEAVGRREPVGVNSGLTNLKNDLLAGVKYGEGFRVVGGHKLRDSVITFAEKPSPEVIAEMKDAGFDWRAADKLWTHPIRPDTAMQDRIHGERVFEAVSAQIRQNRGIEHSAGVAVG